MLQLATETGHLVTNFRVQQQLISLRTTRGPEFVDITGRVAAVVAESGVQYGIANIQTRHTTTGILVNEDEPLLREDIERMLEGVAPSRAAYCHDDLSRRTVNLVPGEPENGHFHCRAALIGASETLNIIAGRLDLGRWQRVFLVELDSERNCQISVLVMGGC